MHQKLLNVSDVNFSKYYEAMFNLAKNLYFTFSADFDLAQSTLSGLRST